MGEAFFCCALRFFHVCNIANHLLPQFYFRQICRTYDRPRQFQFTMKFKPASICTPEAQCYQDNPFLPSGYSGRPPFVSQLQRLTTKVPSHHNDPLPLRSSKKIIIMRRFLVRQQLCNHPLLITIHTIAPAREYYDPIPHSYTAPLCRRVTLLAPILTDLMSGRWKIRCLSRMREECMRLCSGSLVSSFLESVKGLTFSRSTLVCLRNCFLSVT
jgi:hypothetical protein